MIPKMQFGCGLCTAVLALTAGSRNDPQASVRTSAVPVARGVPVAQAPCDGRAGPAQLDGTFLRPFSRRVRQIVTDGSGTVINARIRIHDDLSLVPRGGEEVFRRVITMFRFDGAIYAADTAFFSRGTLAPLENVEWVAGTLAWRRAFGDRGSHVAGQRLVAAAGSGVGAAPSASRNLDVRLPQASLDFYGGMDGIVAASIPHDVGATTCLPAYMPAGDTLGILPLRVVRKEPVEAGEGRFADAVLVETLGTNGPLRLWVSKAPPFILKTEETALQAGKVWRVYTTTMIEKQP